MSIDTCPSSVHDAPAGVADLRAGLALPAPEEPRTQRELFAFMNIVLNGEFGEYRTRLADSDHPDFTTLRGLERQLIFSCDGSIPEDAALTEEQREAVEAVMSIFHPSVRSTPQAGLKRVLLHARERLGRMIYG
ncbi:MAG: hypothetical protein WCV62_04840 [Candidatus Peribacteraceae bacterium]|jgi:hypothetical protein